MSNLNQRKAARKPDAQRYAHFNKNFCNYPMGRDVRHRCNVKRFTNSNRPYLDLPTGEVRFVFSLDSDPSLHRYPTGGEIDLLAQLMAMAKIRGTRQLDFPSKQALLAELGLTGRDSNRKRLIAGLDYWASVQIHHREWHVKAHRPKIEMRIKPPLHWRAMGKGIRTTISEEWMRINYEGGYFIDVHLPLPHHAAGQNLALMMRAFKPNNYLDEFPRRSIATVAPKLGLNSRNHIGRQLDIAVKHADVWYKRGNGYAFLYYRDGEIVAGTEDPKAEPRRRVKRPKTTLVPAMADEFEG